MASHTQVAARINDDRKNLLSAFLKSFANVKNINLKKKDLNSFVTTFLDEMNLMDKQCDFDSDVHQMNLTDVIKNLNNILMSTERVPKGVWKKERLDDCCRCQARAWSGERCPKQKKEKGDYCGTHQNSLDKTGRLPYGRFDEEAPEKKLPIKREWSNSSNSSSNTSSDTEETVINAPNKYSSTVTQSTSMEELKKRRRGRPTKKSKVNEH